MAEQRLFDSVWLSDLPVIQYHTLLDVAHLAVTHSSADALFPALAVRLQGLLNFEFVILGLYEPSTESIRLETWKAGEPQKQFQSISAHTCASGWVWKNQRSLLVHDLDTEPKLPVFLESLRQLGVRTYYVFPLTTRRRRLGAIGFGTLTVVPKANPAHESLRRAAAMIAQFLDAAHSDGGLTAETDPVQITSDVLPGPKTSAPRFRSW